MNCTPMPNVGTEESIYLSLGQLRMAVVNLTAKINSNPEMKIWKYGSWRITFWDLENSPEKEQRQCPKQAFSGLMWPKSAKVLLDTTYTLAPSIRKSFSFTTNIYIRKWADILIVLMTQAYPISGRLHWHTASAAAKSKYPVWEFSQHPTIQGLSPELPEL